MRVLRCRGHFLISANPFLRQEVRVRAAESGRTVLVVDINQKMMLRAFPDRAVHPARPVKGTDVNKTEFDSLQTPFLVERKQFVQLTVKRALIHVNEDADPFLFRVSQDFLKVQIAARIASRINGDSRCVRGHGVLVAVPAGIEVNVLNIVRSSEIDEFFASRGGKRRFAHDSARFDP